MEPPRVHLHPDDAAARGLIDGDPVRVRNDRGAFLAAVAVDHATRPGLAYTYKACWARLSPGRTTVNVEAQPFRGFSRGIGPMTYAQVVVMVTAVRPRVSQRGAGHHRSVVDTSRERVPPNEGESDGRQVRALQRQGG